MEIWKFSRWTFLLCVFDNFLCISKFGLSKGRWRRKTLKLREMHFFIDWNDISLGQMFLQTFLQIGTPYWAFGHSLAVGRAAWMWFYRWKLGWAHNIAKLSPAPAPACKRCKQRLRTFCQKSRYVEDIVSNIQYYLTEDGERRIENWEIRFDKKDLRHIFFATLSNLTLASLC